VVATFFALSDNPSLGRGIFRVLSGVSRAIARYMAKRLTLFAIAASCLTYAGLCGALYAVQDTLLFFPNSSAAVGHRYDEHAIKVRSGDVELRGWFVHREISAQLPLLIYYGGNAEDVSQNLLDQDRLNIVSFLIMNYRGYGGTEGQPGETTLFQDALTVYDHVVLTHHINPAHIVVMGRSLGTGVAVHVASKRPVRGVIVSTSYDSIVAVAEENYALFPVRLLLKHPFDSLSRAPDIKVPMLNLMASHDTLIPNKHSKRLAAAWGGPVTSVTIKGAGHQDIQTHADYWDAINRFLTGAY